MVILLQSANFGKGFLGPDVPLEVVNEFVEMCHQLRVLNSVRECTIGIPITFRQYPCCSSSILCSMCIGYVLDGTIFIQLYDLALTLL